MSKNPVQPLAIIVTFNEGENIKRVVEKIPEFFKKNTLIVDDGSTDNSLSYINNCGIKIISHAVNKGIGAAIKSGIRYAQDNHYNAVIILAGNGKDDPGDLPKFLTALNAEYDYIQGSRNLPGGSSLNLPLFRSVAIKIHALMFSILTQRKCSDTLNGFRAYRLSIFADPQINIWQNWLDRYEYEIYLHYKILKLGYRFIEVPVSKTYPANRRVGYTHIRPFIDWWSIMRPLILLILKIKK